MRNFSHERGEGKRTKAIETALSLTMTLTATCGNAPAFGQTAPSLQKPFEGWRMQQQQPTTEFMYMGRTPEKREVEESPLIRFFRSRNEKELARVGLKKTDESRIVTGLAQRAEMRTYGNKKPELVMYTNTDILDRGIHLWYMAQRAPHSSFSPHNIELVIRRLLDDIKIRTGLPCVIESSTASSNIDLHIFEKDGKNSKSYTGGHGDIDDQRYTTPRGTFADNKSTYADVLLFNHRSLDNPHYRNMPKDVNIGLGIDVMIKTAMHEILTHVILGRNHTQTVGDISRKEIKYKVRNKKHIEAKVKPWSHLYRSANGEEYIANFAMGNDPNDETSLLIRLLRLARMSEKKPSKPPQRTHVKPSHGFR
ncbi:hypothetical protein HY621_03530 [Candidatus Uhrbacteria bacterium]|nr:hypothetical protein [Candidatus Uhrbacteria bacterium]